MHICAGDNNEGLLEIAALQSVKAVMQLLSRLRCHSVTAAMLASRCTARFKQSRIAGQSELFISLFEPASPRWATRCSFGLVNYKSASAAMQRSASEL